MSEFELLAQSLLRKSEEEEKQQQDNDKELIKKVLEIYDQKYVAELLRKVGKNEWSRETLNRWIKEGANKQVISSQADSLIKISRIWADFFPANTSNQPI